MAGRITQTLLLAFAYSCSRKENGVGIVHAGIAGTAVYQPLLSSTCEVFGYPTTYVLDGDDEVVADRTGEAPSSVYEG